MVSVVIPTHNRPELLLRSVRSVLDQSWTDLELIVIDDASAPATAEALATIQDPRLRTFRAERNLRAAAARNWGVDLARGSWLAFNDDDDYWLPTKLERQFAALRATPSEVGFCIAGYRADFGDFAVDVVGTPRFEAMDFRNGPLHGFALIATPGWLIKREVFMKAGGFDPRMRSWDDWELAYRVRKITDWVHAPEVLYVQDRVEGGGMWNNEAVYASDMAVILEKHAADWVNDPKTLAGWNRLGGRFALMHADAVAARRHFREALRNQKWDWRSRLLLLAATVSPGPLAWLLSRHRAAHKRAVERVAQRRVVA